MFQRFLHLRTEVHWSVEALEIALRPFSACKTSMS